jgi:hypothetical protein
LCDEFCIPRAWQGKAVGDGIEVLVVPAKQVSPEAR